MIAMNFLKDIYALFYPEVCLCCFNNLTSNESVICVTCRHDLPLTNFSNQKNNAIETSFYGRIPVENATALFYFFKKGKIQHLIHALKYKKQQQVGTLLGNWLGEEIINSNQFSTIDCIVPVPLHPKKLKSRGYNQVATFGKSLAEKLNKPYIDTVLKRGQFTNTQTKKLRLDRWKNVSDIFFVENNNTLQNKHILLIDDIITTGATLEACYKAFENTKNIKISIASMAYTK
jgi:ComF family protein